MRRMASRAHTNAPITLVWRTHRQRGRSDGVGTADRPDDAGVVDQQRQRAQRIGGREAGNHGGFVGDIDRMRRRTPACCDDAVDHARAACASLR